MLSKLLAILLSSLFLFFNTSNGAVPGTYNVVDLGARPNGKTDSSKAFLSAWGLACGSTTPATIYVPPGKFLVKQVSFEGPCKNRAIGFKLDGTLLAPSDYNVIGNSGYWIYFQRVNGVSIRGGLLDGQGTPLWSCKNSGKKSCPGGATVNPKRLK